VLLVDDQPVQLRRLGRDFARQGITVLEATGTAAALKHAATSAPDLAITDLFLTPPDDGLRLIKALRARYPDIVCVLVSAHMTVAHAVLGMQAGAADVWLKPITATQALQRLCNGPPPLPAATTASLEQIEREHIARVMIDYDGNISHAAEALGLWRQTLQRKLGRLGPCALVPDHTPDPSNPLVAATPEHDGADGADGADDADRRSRHDDASRAVAEPSTDSPAAPAARRNARDTHDR
jgi:two-component system, response regulator RegA